ncbi:TetR family transcriptional regulator [Skermania piniformis]|uniref:TetR family transcriptional regulator n=1 Tax=Skermania pinensis TaxID=39122 RepID=UPI00278BAEC8|nr:TetR family transcriptional regulator [Skermania piniformis]
MSGPTSPSRAERKEQTRQALLGHTLDLSAERGFANVSLREIARATGIVPTAFYRHFASLDELGLALVDDGIRTMRVALREARRVPGPANANDSLPVLFEQVRANRALFRFLYRERYAGPPEMRRAIAAEFDLIERELTVDLSRMHALATWDTGDLELAAGLIVAAVVPAIADFLAAPTPAGEQDVIERVRRQLLLIMLGMGSWRPNRR